MAQSTTMTVRLPADVVDNLERIAKATERSRSYLAGKAIEEFVAAQAWQVAAIEQAVRKADAPGAVFQDHAAVVKRMSSRVRGAGGRRPR